jgi:hypothetical protein
MGHEVKRPKTQVHEAEMGLEDPSGTTKNPQKWLKNGAALKVSKTLFQKP